LGIALGMNSMLITSFRLTPTHLGGLSGSSLAIRLSHHPDSVKLLWERTGLSCLCLWQDSNLWYARP
ncbi:hypothetical protein A2U01_0077784, partial [Trifolium medium]|nr:hypothetical protein [Trifolium medium]